MEKNFNSKNYYEILGVSQTATEREIKIAYREIALVYHPDSHFFDEILGETEKAKNSEIFTKVTEAYHTLVNPVLRAKYDETLPPELPEWEDESEKTEFDTMDEKIQNYILKENITRPKTFGTFGRIEQTEEEEEDEIKTPAKKAGVIESVKKWFMK